MFRGLVGSECSDVDAVLAERVSLSAARAMGARGLHMDRGPLIGDSEMVDGNV
jgi:hypothetical protein